MQEESIEVQEEAVPKLITLVSRSTKKFRIDTSFQYSFEINNDI